ncbi:sodium- and chloride-dependent betaine transporter-like [Ruditapes philippinarum]|uniref:sodium- and chloride-dependent betaine transporter-like n=1 Tax=Ruditapes philippinarum TaxID=129788 RepID=UPI00295A93A7|nr:sodium- and chloride-dependent betaine transporter-like [Ruditapes philippinarum]
MDSTELKQLNDNGLNDTASKELILRKQNDEMEESSGTEVEEKVWLESKKEEFEQDRGEWSNKIEFLLAITGYTVGMGSVWRFPIVCSRNGGGAFLIPFFFCLITSGGPLYYLEVCLGQFTGQSAAQAFEFCSLFKGLGILQVMLSFTVLWYAICVLAWVLYFLYSSFLPTLPWTTCNNPWNTVNCTVIWDTVSNRFTSTNTVTTNSSSVNETILTQSKLYNLTTNMLIDPSQLPQTNITSSVMTSSSSAYEFWE